MSVTFGCPEAPTERLPCPWCGEGGRWVDRPDMLTPEGRCDQWCDGTVEESVAPEVNLSNHNAGNILHLLGLFDPEGPWGSLSVEEIPAVLQRCMVVLARETRRAHLVEDTFEEGGQRRLVVNEEGLPEIQTGCRVIHCGNTDEDTVRRIEALRDLLAWAHEHGLRVCWG